MAWTTTHPEGRETKTAMKALCIKEPHASRILRGDKTIETRSWKTNYRGRLLLCASLKPKSELSGYAFMIASLLDCVPMTKEHEEQACCEMYPGAYAWILGDMRVITRFKVRGQLGLFEV